MGMNPKPVCEVGDDVTQEWWLRDQDNTSQVKSWMKTQEVTWPWDRNT